MSILYFVHLTYLLILLKGGTFGRASILLLQPVVKVRMNLPCVSMPLSEETSFPNDSFLECARVELLAADEVEVVGTFATAPLN